MAVLTSQNSVAVTVGLQKSNVHTVLTVQAKQGALYELCAPCFSYSWHTTYLISMYAFAGASLGSLNSHTSCRLFGSLMREGSEACDKQDANATAQRVSNGRDVAPQHHQPLGALTRALMPGANRPQVHQRKGQRAAYVHCATMWLKLGSLMREGSEA